jgi:hypothetical protein
VAAYELTLVRLIEFSSSGWEDWDVEHRPLLRERMPVLIDDDLRFEDDGGVQRPTTVVNAWLRELPVSGAPSPRSWRIYAEAARAWLEFLAQRGVGPFESRERLRAALSAYAEYRLAGPAAARWQVSTWNLHAGVLAAFYEWAAAERYASAVPFSYVMAHGRSPSDRPTTPDQIPLVAPGPSFSPRSSQMMSIARSVIVLKSASFDRVLHMRLRAF